MIKSMFVDRHRTLQLDIITDMNLKQSVTEGLAEGEPSSVQVVQVVDVSTSWRFPKLMYIHCKISVNDVRSKITAKNTYIAHDITFVIQNVMRRILAG
jgi:hypothetical protein